MLKRQGLFITFEGGEGCGKSTQARLLFNSLEHRGIPSVLTHEPGGTPLGNRIRGILKVKRDFDISPQAELFLFAACRAQLIREVILPALDVGRNVICDRFSASTIAYQGYGRGLGQDLIESINRAATGGLEPDLIFLLDIQSETGLSRKHNTGDDRFEAEHIAFHRRVRVGYLELARRDPGRWIVIEARQPVETLAKAILDHVLAILHKAAA
ncbi:MAG: dTMP kinase [Chloroflexi bacterium]|jgi:dTMP kinase|nr:dTMP kinase [Chloroflexota bacterium]